MPRKTVFISYAHEDVGWLKRVSVFMKPLRREYSIDFWDDRQIRSGDDWRETLEGKIKSTDLAVLLISPNFLASDFIVEDELPLLQEAANSRGIKILSVILRPCRNTIHDIFKYQTVNTPDNALNELDEGEQDRILVELVDAVERNLNNPGRTKIEVGSTASNKRALVLDVDGTLFYEGEDLYFNDRRNLLPLFEQLARSNLQLIFLTGNDFDHQKPRVLSPLVNSGLGTSVLCFADGGSRFFEFDPYKHDFVEQYEYSREHLIEPQDLDEIECIFSKKLTKFLKNNPELNIPDISLFRQEEKLVDLWIYPIKPSFFNKSIDFFISSLEKELNDIEMNSEFEILDGIVHGSMIVRISGLYCFVDAFSVQSRLKDFLSRDFPDISTPEFYRRGGENHVCQVAMKPFKIDKIRTKFLHEIRHELSRNELSKSIVAFLGGKTTIDVHRRNVNKSTAVLYLIESKGFRPENLIYFGDEFVEHGNDLPIAEMDSSAKPRMIIHVGNKDRTPDHLKRMDGLVLDGNGPSGTQNYLRFLSNELM